MARRIPRWSLWVALLAACSLLFLLLHVSWSQALVLRYAREAVAPGAFLAGLPPASLVNALGFAARLGVLVAAVGVLLNLEGAPDEDAPVQRKKSK